MKTKEQIREILFYDPQDGTFRWLDNSVGGWAIPGRRAGSARDDGYVRIRIYKKYYYAHRLAFLYMDGVMPACVDHINRDTTDNRWENLRAVSRSENGRNRGVQKGGSNKFKGVYWDKQTSKYRVTCVFNGKTISCGRHITPEEAAEVYDKKVVELYGASAVTNKSLGLL